MCFFGFCICGVFCCQLTVCALGEEGKTIALNIPGACSMSYFFKAFLMIF